MLSTPAPVFNPLGAAAGAWASCHLFDGEVQGAVRVALAGELDIAAVPRVDSVLRQAQAGADVVVLDLRGVWFMDCSGAHLVVAADGRARRGGGRLVVVRAPAEVDWFFELLGLDRQLEIVDEPPADAVGPQGLRSVAA